MTLHFSQQPGCWERHLQRQYENPLFTDVAQPLTQQKIDAARRQDENETQAFKKSFQALLEEVAALDARVEVEVVLKLGNRIESLYEQGAGLREDLTAEKQGLRKLSELIMQSLWSSATLDAQTQEQLAKETVERERHFSLLEHPVIAHLLHPQSPITQTHIVPTLLTENEAAIQAAMSLFEQEQRAVLCQEAKRLITQLETVGYTLPIARMRLAIMEQTLDKS
jgi:hypothetical protein